MIVETQLNPTQPVNQQIYRILRRDIVHCLIPPGTPLSEKEVSIRFDVSRQPVREAFIAGGKRSDSNPPPARQLCE
jgi:DNA-binding GntR family transcriptional regulator